MPGLLMDQPHEPAPPLTPAELDALRKRHAPIPSPGCTVCRLLRMLDDLEQPAVEAAIAAAKEAIR